MKQTQLDRIINLCRNGEWICQTSFWEISKSPHKRRSDIEKEGIWKFEPRKCTHGIKNSHDFRMMAVNSHKVHRETWFDVVTNEKGERVAKQVMI